MRAFSFVFICAALPLAAACSLNPFGGSDDGNSSTPSSNDDDAGSISSRSRDAGSSRDSGARGGDAGSRGDGGASTTRPDGGSSGPGAECSALSDCCSTLDSDMYSGCMSIVTGSTESGCESALSSYTSGGYCTGGTSCATLSSCCSTLPAGPGWADTCNQYVDLDNDSSCASLDGTYQNDGYCTGNPGGLSNNCYALESCCEFLSDPDYTTCEGYVSANVDGTCQSADMNYVNEGLCE
ncbi:MAG: hypothetical protein ACRELY_01895 [Polyangiaceae bacterium]